jgi:hypothetical protein
MPEFVTSYSEKERTASDGDVGSRSSEPLIGLREGLELEAG